MALVSTVFIVSLVSNAVPFASLPYLVFLSIVASRVRDPYLVSLLVLVSAAGASIGKVSVYLLGRLVYRTVSEETRENIRYLSERVGRAGFIAVFIAAATPIPDDIVNLPVSFIGYRIIYYVLAVFSGKIVVTTMATVAGASIIQALEQTGLGPLWPSIIFLLLSLYITYLVARIDWRHVVEGYEKRGLREAVERLVREALRKTLGAGRPLERAGAVYR